MICPKGHGWSVLSDLPHNVAIASEIPHAFQKSYTGFCTSWEIHHEPWESLPGVN